MITKLTKEQEQKIPKYFEEWLKTGLSTKRYDKERVTFLVQEFYKNFSESLAIPEVIFTESPKQANDLVNSMLPKSQQQTVVDSFRPTLWWSGYYCFYNFVLNELMPEKKNDFPLLPLITEITRTIHWMIPLTNTCIVSQPPVEIHMTAEGRLHNPNGMSCKYSDGFGIYTLNGVSMKQEHVETPAEQINPLDVMRETNVEVRRELLRKVGLTRMLEHMKAKELDSYVMIIPSLYEPKDIEENTSIAGIPKTLIKRTLERQNKPQQHEYTLYEVTLDTNVTAKVLKMKNPSIDTYHVEGVPDEIKTCKEALAWRNHLDGEFVPPIDLT